MTKKLIIAGSRSILDYDVLLLAIEKSGFNPDDYNVVVSGCALGADSLGIRYAMETKKKIMQFPVSAADWRLHGPSAGPIRNQKMAEVGDALIALWDGESKGTMDMVRRMRAYKKPVFVFCTTDRNTLEGLC